MNDKKKNVVSYSVDYFCVQALLGNTVQEPVQNRFFIFFLELLAKTFPLAEADHKMFKSPGMMSNLTKFLELSKETEDVITQIFLSKWNVQRKIKCDKTKDFYWQSKQEFQKMSLVKILILGNVGVVPFSAVYVAVLVKV